MSVKWSKWLFYVMLLTFGAVVAPPLDRTQAAPLEDTLYEKGILTKEEWEKLKSEKEEIASKTETLEEQVKKLEKLLPVRSEYLPGKGLLFESKDGNYALRLHWRFQSRFSFPIAGDPITAAQFNEGDTTNLQLTRARIKAAGHIYKPWIEYYMQFNWPTSTLYDFRMELTKYKAVRLLVGLDKIPFNREWMTSSRNQFAVDRSLVQRQFTSGRSVGASLLGHLFSGTAADIQYWAGVWNGTGLTQSINDDSNPLYVGRFQWNPLGRPVDFFMTDIKFSEKPALSLAVAAMDNVSPYTRWNDNGGVGGMLSEIYPCGTTPGISCSNPNQGQPGQFRDNQVMAEAAFHYRGWAIEHEFHWKTITDNLNQTKDMMYGSFAQISYFPHYLIPAIPQPLNGGFRYSFVKPQAGLSTGLRQEYTGVLNWFFFGHNNKLTLDYSYLTLDAVGGQQYANRMRFQWEVQF